MADSPYIVDLNEQNFMEIAIEGSDRHAVLIDFWADWCQPCKNLAPVLEKLADEYQGAFILAKLDTEAYPGIAQQLGIRSLPTVKLIRNRQQVDEFAGALPESEIRRFLETHLGPAPEAGEQEAGEGIDPRLNQAMLLHEQGQSSEAMALLQAAQAEDPENKDILLTLGQLAVALGEYDIAESCLNALPEEERSSDQAERLSGLLALARESDNSVDTDALRAELEADAGNSQARYQLAIAESLAGNVQSALDNLLYIVHHDPEFDDGAARKQMLSLFQVLGSDPLVSQYRRKLFATMH